MCRFFGGLSIAFPTHAIDLGRVGADWLMPDDGRSPVLDCPPTMAPTQYRPESWYGYLLLAALFCSACSATVQTGKVIVENSRGIVFLRSISDRSVRASHPITLDPALIARVLSGLYVQERQRGLQEMLAGSPTPIPAFSEDQVQFLAPQIAAALTAATMGEAVAFRVTHSRPGATRLESAVTETTAGSLYAHGLSLYVTLSQYRYAPVQANADGAARRQLPDATGLSNRTLHFTPSAAQRPEGYYPPTSNAGTDRVVAIDYQMLQPGVRIGAATEPAASQIEQISSPAQEPHPANRSSDTASRTAETLAQRDAEIHTLKDLIVRKDLELESLKKELQSVRQRLAAPADVEANRKRKLPTPSKPPPGVP